ncbi:bacterioferritin [Alteromonadaceae bacterium Bs31]|nr:bacterioferritin [Alteromonadaceae bacterium Bs31]
MKTDSQIISTLNAVLTVELTSINRYFLHARMYKNWGFENLDHVSYKKSIKDMKQADKLIERILFLEGLPNLQKLDPLQVGENTEEMLNCDLLFQQDNTHTLKQAIATCEQLKDYVSRSLLQELLEYEEAHLDWLEAQQHQIAELGLQNYLQAQISEGE